MSIPRSSILPGAAVSGQRGDHQRRVECRADLIFTPEYITSTNPILVTRRDTDRGW